MRLLKILTCCILINLIGVSAHASAVDWAQGSWGVSSDKKEEKQFGCNVAPLVVNIDTEKMRYQGTRRDGDKDAPLLLDRAEILSITDKGITIQYDDEDRLMTNRDLQIWIMFFINPDEFVWIRQDWLKDGEVTGATASRHRCRTQVS